MGFYLLVSRIGNISSLGIFTRKGFPGVEVACANSL